MKLAKRWKRVYTIERGPIGQGENRAQLSDAQICPGRKRHSVGRIRQFLSGKALFAQLHPTNFPGLLLLRLSRVAGS